MNTDFRESIALLKSQLEKLEGRIDRFDSEPKEESEALSRHLQGHIAYLNLLLQQESIPHPGIPGYEKWKQENPELVGSVIPWDKIDDEIRSIAEPLVAPVRSIAKTAKGDAESALAAAKGLENKLDQKLRDALTGLISDIENVETIIQSAILNMLIIAGKVPGSIGAKNMDGIIKGAEDALRKRFMEELNNEESALHKLLELLKLVHALAALGQDLVERVEIVIHSVKDLGKDTQAPLIKLLEAAKDLFEAIKDNNEKEILEKFVELLVAVMVTINPIAAALIALFVGEKRSLRELLMPGIPQSGTLYQWLTEVSDRKSLTGQRIRRELAFRRMVVGAVDSYLRTGHTGKKAAVANSATPQADPGVGELEPGGAIRPVDLRPLVASGVELANVFCGALFSFLFIPPGVPNPSIPKLPHRSVSKPHPFDFRADMAASVARTLIQPVMSIAAVVLNGFWEISPNNRALVNAVSGYVGNVIRSLVEHLVSGILHLFEIHEVYPEYQQPKRGYLKVAAWNSWNETPGSREKLKFGIYLDARVAFHFLDENIDKKDEKAVQEALEATAGKLRKLIGDIEEDDKKTKKEDSILLGLLKDYVAYREAVMEYRAQRADSQGMEIEKFSVTRKANSDTVKLDVTLDKKTLSGPTVPVVRVVGGDMAPMILMPESDHTYNGELNIPPLSLFTNQLDLYASTNYGGLKSAKAL